MEPACLLARRTGTSASEAAADAEARTRPRRESSVPARLPGEFPEASSALWLSNISQVLSFLFFIAHTFSTHKTTPPTHPKKKQRYA